MTEVIRPTLFDAFIECPRKAWMLQHQEAPPPHRYAEWLFRKQQRYVENASLHLASERFDEQPQCGLHCLSRRGEQNAVGFLRSETVSTRAKLKLAYRCSMLPASRRTVAKAILVYGAEFTQTVIKLAPLYER